VYNNIEMPLVPVLAAMERRGVAVSASAVDDAIEFFEMMMIMAEARAHLDIPTSVNIGSSDQLARWLEDEGAPITKRTEGKGLLATDENTLRSIEGWHDDTMKAILDYKMFRKLSAFPKKFKELSGWDGALHPNFNQGGYYEESSDSSGSAPATGRLSCSTPNLQQVPHHGRGKGPEYEEYGRKIRACLVARDGYLLVAADVGQQEPRIASLVAPEPTLRQDFEDGLTPYALIGKDIYGRPITKGVDEQEWHTAKTFFLALVYGARAGKLIEIDPRLSMKQSVEGYNRVVSRYPGLARMQDKVVMEIHDQGYARDYFGRIRWFPGIYSADENQRATALREAINFHIQGPAASCIKIAMRKLWEGIEASGLDAHLLLQVHDELILEVRKEDLDTTMQLVYHMLDGVMPIDFPIEPEVGENWAMMKPYE
jgi:DNA polymerase-1